MKRLSIQLLICVLTVMTGISPALADDTSARQEMLRLSAEGQSQFEGGRLGEAAETYAKAYEAYPQAILLKNQMIARYLLEECEEAVELGEVYMATGEASEEDQEDVRAVYGECSLDLAEAAVEKEQWTTALEWLEFGEEYLLEAQLQEDASRIRETAENALEADDDDDDDQSSAPGRADVDSGGSNNLVGYSLVGGGVAMLAGATVWYFRAQSMFNELVDAEGDRERFNELNENQNYTARINRARWAVPTLYAVGGLVTAAGVVLLVLPADEEPGATAFTPIISSEMTGAAWSIRF